MLPQIIPLPWLSIFFIIFIAFYTIYLYSSYFLTGHSTAQNYINPLNVSYSW